MQVNVTDMLFNWIEQRSDSPTPRPFPPLLGIPYDVDEVRNRLPSDFSFLGGLLVTAPIIQAVSVRTANPLAIAAGYGLDIGSNAVAEQWESFQENFLTVNGSAHDWGVALDPAIVQQVLDQTFAGMSGQSIEINEQTEDFFIERFVIETISGTNGNPIQMHVRGEVIKSGPDVDVEFDLTARCFSVKERSRTPTASSSFCTRPTPCCRTGGGPMPSSSYPTEAMRDYHATFRIQSNAGEIVVLIHGRVQTLPELTTGGMTAYLPAADLCVPPNALYQVEPLLERAAGEQVVGLDL